MKSIRARDGGFTSFQVIVVVALVGIFAVVSYVGVQTYLDSHPGTFAKAKPTPKPGSSKSQVCDRVEADRGCVLNGFEVLTPNGGESICYGDVVKVTWKVPPGVESVTLRVSSSPSAAQGYEIASVRASDGELEWPVEDLDNGAYKIWMNTTYKGSSVNDSSDRIFTIADC